MLNICTNTIRYGAASGIGTISASISYRPATWGHFKGVTIMPNGIMTGDGTREAPFVVMDALDFNALRNVPATTTATSAFVELGADINLGTLPNFTPIPSRFLNIDGKGHKIQHFTSSASGTGFGLTVGLFTSLSCTEYLRNIVIEGMVSLRATGNGSGSAGLW